MAANTVSIGSLVREIEDLRDKNRVLTGILIEICRCTYANSKSGGAQQTTLDLLKRNGEILKRLMDS